jgi:hypothetical protein
MPPARAGWVNLLRSLHGWSKQERSPRPQYGNEENL